MIRVLIYTEYMLAGAGLGAVLARDPEFSFAGTCPSPESLLERLKTGDVDIVILDVPAWAAPATIKDLHKVTSAHLVVMADAVAHELAFQAMGAGLRGILRRSMSGGEIIEALKQVAQGKLSYDKQVSDEFLVSKRVVLTNREGDLVDGLVRGLSNKQIADRLRISEGTVKVYLSRLYQKTGARNRWEMALWGMRNLAAGTEVSGKAFSPRSLVLPRAA